MKTDENIAFLRETYDPYNKKTHQTTVSKKEIKDFYGYDWDNMDLQTQKEIQHEY